MLYILERNDNDERSSSWNFSLFSYFIAGTLLSAVQKELLLFKSLETLASKLHFPGILQQDSAYIYDSIMPYLKVILETATKDTSRTLLAKSIECITRVTMAFGNQAIRDYVEKVNTIYIFPLALSRHYVNVKLSTYLKMHLPHVMSHFRSLQYSFHCKKLKQR